FTSPAAPAGRPAVGNVPGFDFPTGYTAFQYVFVLLQSAAFGGVFTGFGIARGFETGFRRRAPPGRPRPPRRRRLCGVFSPASAPPPASETASARRSLLAATDRRGIIAGYGIAALARAFVTWTVLTVVALVAGMNID